MTHKTLVQMTEEQTTAKLVQDRKTGEWYDPQEAFDSLMKDSEIQAVLRRLAVH